MSIIDTLITDRTAADLSLVRQLNATGWAAMSEDQRALYLSEQLKGAYKASDLNRVNAAMDYLAARLKAQGINVALKRSKIPHKGGGGGSRLPAGFVELAYIQSTGTQHINTNFAPKYNTRVVADISDATIESFIFGARDTDSTTAAKQFGAYITAASAIRSDYFGTSASGTPGNIAARTTIDKNANVTTAFGLTITNTAVSTGTVTHSLYLFALNTVGTVKSNASVKLYSCQIYDNSTLVRDYVPCKNPSEEIGLYDMVNGVFYGNSGTGVFYGAEARELPEGYTQVEYIESNGTQYIDTLFKPNQDTRVVMETELTNVTATQFMFCSRGGPDENYSNPFGVLANKTALRSDYGTSRQTFSLTAAVGTRYCIDKNKATCTINSASVTNAANSFQCAYNLFLFASPESGAPNYFVSAKLYSCQIYDNGALVRDYVPSVDSSGIAGLYDLVNGVFYADAAGGTFTVGDVIELPADVVYDDYTWYDHDVPSAVLLNEHLVNVAAVRASLQTNVPQIPSDMDDGLTIEEANNIEIVLVNIEAAINNMFLAWAYCAEIYSGEV